VAAAIITNGFPGIACLPLQRNPGVGWGDAEADLVLAVRVG